MPKLPTVAAKKFCAMVEKRGCTLDRIVGDHRIYVKEGLKRPVVVPMYREVPTFIVMNNLRTLGMSRSEFIRALKEI